MLGSVIWKAVHIMVAEREMMGAVKIILQTYPNEQMLLRTCVCRGNARGSFKKLVPQSSIRIVGEECDGSIVFETQCE